MRYRKEFSGVTVTKDRHGKLRYRLRRTVKGRRIDQYLPGVIGSTEFRAAYEEACEGVRVAARGARPGTVAYLIEAYLDSVAYRNLAPVTRRNKRGRFDWIKAAIGDAPYAKILPRHVEDLMLRKGGPMAGNRLKKDLSQLFRFAAKRFGYTGQNPAAMADARKGPSGGFHTWTDEEIAVYRAAHATGTKARLAFEIFLGTGAARQDAAALTRRNIRGARLFYRRGKTGQEVDLPILPELAAELAHLPPDQMMLLAHGEEARPYSAVSLGKWFGRRCNEAGLPHCAAHGLRKAGARRLAEAGATEFEVMSFLAHSTAAEASRYVAAANRSTLTTSGLAKLSTNPERRLSNLSSGLGNSEA